MFPGLRIFCSKRIFHLHGGGDPPLDKISNNVFSNEHFYLKFFCREFIVANLSIHCAEISAPRAKMQTLKKKLGCGFWAFFSIVLAQFF